ncbi:unnamed protein product [Soboliphyme baturini]|uniref:Transmembrane protein 164 n=1 Tax=Soboliphyme baturini TaxID=241478 RepID=A0A183IZD0_9BILA|nr:unnamed protein product [Soboliphyme baturini]
MRYLSNGINFSLPGTGGANCVRYLSVEQKLLETILSFALGIYEVRISLPKILRSPAFQQEGRVPNQPSCSVRYLLTALLVLAFSAEIFYKVLTESLLFLLNPCHVTTVLQLISLLSYSPSYFVRLMYGISMYMVSGATLAILFPVTNTRLYPGEVLSYYIHHFIMLLVPAYFLSLGGFYGPDSFINADFYRFVHGLLMLYNFGVLQLVGTTGGKKIIVFKFVEEALCGGMPCVLIKNVIVDADDIHEFTQVNLNCILCPAVSDPFSGRYYRICAVIHQTLFVPAHCYLHVTCSRKLLRYLSSKRKGRKSVVPLPEDVKYFIMNGTHT